jgi:hypothetical protein
MPQNRSQLNNTLQQSTFQKMYHLKIAFIFTNPSLTLFGPPITGCLFPYPLSLEELKSTIMELYDPNAGFPVTHPWQCEKRGDMRNAFWKYYLGKDPVEGCPTISENVISNIANRCTKRFIPFHHSMTRHVSLTWPDKPSNGNNIVSFEGYIYRHGLSLIATANIFDCNSIEELILRARQFRYDSIFSLASDTSRKCSLSRLSGLLLAQLGKLCGITANHDCDMLSVAAFDVENIDATKLPVNTELQRALEAVTSWSSSWQTNSLPGLAYRSITVKIQQNNDLLYGTDKGRAIWLPRLFTCPDKKNYALRWYYRNLVISTMHVMSLCCFAGIVEGAVSGNPILRDYLNMVENEIQLFKTGSNKRYRSRSLEKLIEDMCHM